MSRVKMGFTKLSVTEQFERARQIVTAMTGNTNYTTPAPALSDISDAADALETAYNESRGRDKNKIAIMRLRRKDLLFVIRQEAAYVQQASGGEEEIILSSGFDVAAPRSISSDTAGQVLNVRLSDGSEEHKIRVDFDEASDAVLYLIESSATADFAVNDFAGGTTKTHKEVGPFTPGSRVWIRIFAHGREHPGLHSEPVSILVR